MTHARTMFRNGSTRWRLSTILVLATAVGVAGIFAPAPAFADETRDQQWYLDALQIDKVHELSQGEGVTIGVIDSGIDATHPDLKDNVKAGKDYGKSKGNGLDDARDHGTSTTSLMVGHGHGENQAQGIMGIAPKAEVISVGVHWDKSTKNEVGSYISEAIKWLVDKEVDLITVGIGAVGELWAVKYAKDKGVPVVAPAGNVESDPILGDIDDISWPASAPGAVPVSGTTKDGKFWEGSIDLGWVENQQPKFGVSAPATDLVTAKPGGGYATHDGTSGAATLVAGTLALVKSAYPDLSYWPWMNRMLKTADDKSSKGFDDKYGWGIINPYRALTEETVYEDVHGQKEVSTPSDRIPLEEQGRKTSDEQNKKKDEGSTLTASSSSTAITVTIAVAVASLVGAIVILVLVKRRKSANS